MGQLLHIFLNFTAVTQDYITQNTATSSLAIFQPVK